MQLSEFVFLLTTTLRLYTTYVFQFHCNFALIKRKIYFCPQYRKNLIVTIKINIK